MAGVPSSSGCSAWPKPSCALQATKVSHTTAQHNFREAACILPKFLANAKRRL
jgi:hypothetical protein